MVIGAKTSSVNDIPELVNDEFTEENPTEDQEPMKEISHTSEIDSPEIVEAEWGAEQDNEMNRAADMLRNGDSSEVITMIEGEFIQKYSTQARPHKILGNNLCSSRPC